MRSRTHGMWTVPAPAARCMHAGGKGVCVWGGGGGWVGGCGGGGCVTALRPAQQLRALGGPLQRPQLRLCMCWVQVAVGEDGHPEVYGPPIQELAGDLPLRPSLLGNLVPQQINLWAGCAPDGAWPGAGAGAAALRGTWMGSRAGLPTCAGVLAGRRHTLPTSGAGTERVSRCRFMSLLCL
jgi:hypothetical protein